MRSTCLAAAFCLALGASATAQVVDAGLSPDDGLRVDFPLHDVSLRLGGRLHLDGAVFEDDESETDNDFEVRRARPYLEVRVGDDWRAKAEYEVTAGDHGWRNVWLGFDGLPRTHLRLGNQTLPFGLEESASSNDVVFAERSVASGLTSDFGTAFSARVSGRLFARARGLLAAGVYMEPFGNMSYDRHRSEHVGGVGRAVLAPYVRKRRVIQLGGSIDYRDLYGDDRWRISQRPESALAPRLTHVTLSDVDTVLGFGVEAAAEFGPLLLQGEYLRSEIQRQSDSSLDDPSFYGGYAQASYVLTGERHRYARSTATFGSVKPRHRWGAVELAARASALDLNDSGVDGGRVYDYTAGLNWYLRENLRLTFDYIYVDGEQSGTRDSDDPQIFQFRFMFFL